MHTNSILWGVVCIGSWWLVASLLLFFAWNKVISFHAKVKLATFPQALLLVAAVSVFCLPKHMSKHHGRYGGGKSWCKKSHGNPSECNHSDCKSGECEHKGGKGLSPKGHGGSGSSHDHGGSGHDHESK